MGPARGALNEHLAAMAMAAIGRPYPFHLQHLVLEPGQVSSPRELHPVFHGCFDWHSAVHGHWTLVRLLRGPLEDTTRAQITAVLTRSFAAESLAREAEYLARPGRESFERPYGLAWCLALAAELGALDAPKAGEWSAALAPLADAARANLEPWLRNLHRPVRCGTHQQSAFALGLMLDWAERGAHQDERARLRATALRLYRGDRDAPLDYEPSGEDFLSPCLMEAELMSRTMPRSEFAAWLEEFLPAIPHTENASWLPIVGVVDEADGKAVHLHGLNLSRAWNLERIAAALPPGDCRGPALRECASRHAAAGLAAIEKVSAFTSTHWLATFAVFLLTRPSLGHTDDSSATRR